MKTCGTYKCDICNKVLANSRCMKKHIKKQHNQEKFKCDACEISFSTSKKLLMHKRTLHDAGKVSCSKCEKMFNNMKALRRHKKNMCEYRSDQISPEESSIDDRNEITQTAQRKNSSFPNTKKQNANEEPINQLDKIYSCEVCKKEFKSRSGLWKHIKTHQIVSKIQEEEEKVLLISDENQNIPEEVIDIMSVTEFVII